MKVRADLDLKELAQTVGAIDPTRGYVHSGVDRRFYERNPGGKADGDGICRLETVSPTPWTRDSGMRFRVHCQSYLGGQKQDLIFDEPGKPPTF